MPSFSLRAHTQNGDWEGTSAADDMDFNKVYDYLKKNQLIQKGEFLAAIKIQSNESHNGELFPPEITFFLSPIPQQSSAAGYGVDIANQNKNKHIKARIVNVKSSFDEVFGLFKRFDIILTPKHMNLIGRTLSVK